MDVRLAFLSLCRDFFEFVSADLLKVDGHSRPASWTSLDGFCYLSCRLALDLLGFCYWKTETF